jgi:hypothetical protein
MDTRLRIAHWRSLNGRSSEARCVLRFRVVEHVDAVILIAEIDQVCLYQVELGPRGRPLLFRPDPTAPTSMDKS